MATCGVEVEFAPSQKAELEMPDVESVRCVEEDCAAKTEDEKAAVIQYHTVPNHILEILTCRGQREWNIFNAEWDAEGVYFYQYYNDEIADHALRNGRLGGDKFDTNRMTWIKPSFGWTLGRSDYAQASSKNQDPRFSRILKVKLAHKDVAKMMEQCKLQVSSRAKDKAEKVNRHRTSEAEGDDEERIRVGGKGGRVQWDPERSMSRPTNFKNKRTPEEAQRLRAIQIGLSGGLSKYYVERTLSIEEKTALAHEVFNAHNSKDEKKCKACMEKLQEVLPIERPYMPALSEDQLTRLQLVLLQKSPNETDIEWQRKNDVVKEWLASRSHGGTKTSKLASTTDPSASASAPQADVTEGEDA